MRALVAVLLLVSACERRPIKPIVVEGTIQSVHIEAGRNPMVLLHRAGAPEVTCSFPLDRIPEISKLGRAQMLRARGTLIPTSHGTELENCAIEYAGPKPGVEENEGDD
ncbi:MAG TPA: hypothetical protein VKN99_08315 [Polyangia bacterium]|nr:hypothetical protein [Polyangia bacterium]